MNHTVGSFLCLSQCFFFPSWRFTKHISILSVLFFKDSSMLMCAFVRLDCYNEIPYWVAFKQQKCISHSSGGWQVKDQGASRWEPASWFIDNCLLSCSHMVEGVRDLSGIPFILALILFIKAPPSGSNHFPKIQPPNTITMEIKIQHMNSEGNINYSVYRNV